MMDTNHISKLEEYVFAFDKTLTYKIASALLGVKSDVAIEILQKFVKHFSSDSEKKVHVSYLLGVRTTEGSKKIIAVDENNYERVKSTYDDIFIDQIYSIQKAKVVNWDSIFNLDDLLYLEKKKENIKTEPKTQVEKSPPKKVNVANTKVNNKPINNLFNQPKSSKPEHTKEPLKKIAPKQKKNDIKNLFGNIKPKPEPAEEKLEVNTNSNVSDDDDDIIIHKKSTKKRVRIIDDDEEIENISKQMKADILDSDNESEKENKISDNEESDDDKLNQNIKEEDKMEVGSPVSEDETPEETEAEPKKEEPRETMYQDDEGYFVTEKTSFKKTPKDTKSKVVNKKETKQQKKEEKQSKKEMAEKLKKNNNQKTLFNFFKKM